jgi:hypothetical protein
MNNKMKEVNFHKLSDKAMKPAFKKSFELIQSAIMTHIWPKLCTVEKVTIPSAIPEHTFDKLLTDIFNTFKQNDTSFPEKLKITIEELVLETLETLCDDATNYIFKKATSINELPSDLKIFKTKIIIDKNRVHRLIKNYTWEPISTNSSTKLKRSSSIIITSSAKNYEEMLIGDPRRDPFGKTQYDYFIEATKTFDNFDFDDIQLLSGTIDFIKFLRDKIIAIPIDKLKYLKIRRFTDFLYEILYPLDNNFFNFFNSPDKKIGKNKEATNYQTYTKRRILNKLRGKIAPFRFPIINNNRINFLHPIKEIDPFDFNNKSEIRIVIDTRILSTDYATGKEEAFFRILNRRDIAELGSTWYKVIEEDINQNSELYKEYKNYRLKQYKDITIKLLNFISFRYRGTILNKKHIQAKPIAPITIKELENKILSDDRIDKYLKKIRNYNPTNRLNTISTRKKIKTTTTLIAFKVLCKCNYIKELPKVTADGKYHIKMNPFKLDKLKANRLLKKEFKIRIN